MKIALVCPYDISYPGGVTSHVVQFAQHARKLGHEVTVIAPSSRKHDGIVNAGKAVPIPIKGGTVSRLALSFWNFPKIKRLFNKGKYDVIHIHEPGVPLLGLFALGYAPAEKSAIVATFHSNTQYNLLLKSYGRTMTVLKLSSLLNSKVDMRIAVSQTARKLPAFLASFSSSSIASSDSPGRPRANRMCRRNDEAWLAVHRSLPSIDQSFARVSHSAAS